MTQISYCKIFPAIGFARVGNSTNLNENDGWFIGPETQDEVRVDNFTYKDDEGKIKRQAARFRLYAFDKDDNPIKEITLEDADVKEIEWSVELANKKSSWFTFQGGYKAMSAFRAEVENIPDSIRNPKHGGIELAADKLNYMPTKKRAEILEIHGGVKTISGKSIISGVEFVGKFKKNHEVYLGELKTDSKGNLIVLGGRGISDAITDNGRSTDDDGIAFKTKRWIRNYANNDDWHDDVSDGPVTARVVLKDGSDIIVKDGAWIVVAPPDFAPDVKNIITLADVMEEVAINNEQLLNKTTPEVNPPDEVYFERDIKPVLQRMHSQRWISARALRGHGTSKPGDFQNDNANNPNEIDGNLSDKNSERGKQIRGRIFTMLREPAYCIVENDKVVDRYKDNTTAISQATTTYMPPLAGDEGDPVAGNPRTWLSLTDIQYARFKNWSDNKFSNEQPIASNNLKKIIDSLTITSLNNCAGGAFYPGIEMTSITRDPKLYCEAFRLNQNVLSAGDVTKYMAVPWQADFWECQMHWWPAQRPDDVISDEEFKAIFSKFNEDVKDNYEKALFKRIRWDRGIGKKSRPSNEYLINRLLPEIQEEVSTNVYIDFLSTGKSVKIKNIKFDPISNLFRRVAGIGDYIDLLDDPSKNGSKLPSPWRVQFTAQEALDSYSGLYFHLEVPSPSSVFSLSSDLLSKNFKFSAEELRREWSTFRLLEPEKASAILGGYANEVYLKIVTQVRDILMQIPAAKESVKDFRKFLLENSTSRIEGLAVSSEIFGNSDILHNLIATEMIENAIDFLYLLSSNYSGDMDMVNDWKKLGFVVTKKIDFSGNSNIIQTETVRSKYEGKSFKDYFYYLMNIDEYPDFIEYSRVIVDEILYTANQLIEDPTIFDSSHPESFVEYSKTTFAAKLEEIYEILRKQAADAEGFRTKKTRSEWTRAHLDSAPFNQTDGSWLRFIANSGPTDKVTSLLFEVWSDEFGNGDPALHHGNLFTQLLASFGLSLPPINSRAYVDDPNMDESLFISPVFQLAISQHSQSYFPELLGMTLFLEWEVLSLVPGVKGRDYMGIDSHFWQMHVGIDNASNGHGAKAREAIEIYLDSVSKEGGNDAVQTDWKRIWKGFVAFASAGYGYFSNKEDIDNQRSDLDLSRKHPSSPEDNIKSLMSRKAAYGSLNHLDKNMGGHRINDLFDEPDMFVEQLANSPYITPGKPEESKLINHLTTFEGPMYKVFNEKDLQLWKNWIIWLDFEGDSDSQKKYLTKAESMFILLNELRELAQSTGGHKRYGIEKAEGEPGNKKGKKITVSDFFNGGNLEDLMKALKQPDNGWVVPFNPAASPIVVDFAKADRPMGAALDRRFKKLGNQIGRVVLIKWIEAGCPLLEDTATKELKPSPSVTWNGKKLLVQQIGMGAVH